MKNSYYVVANKDSSIISKSSSGGLFTALADVILKQGGVVYGAVFDKDTYSIKHISANKIEDIAPMRKSKYVYSDWSYCINDIKQYLKKGIDVLFSGTPCQVASIRQILGYNVHLFLVDFFCHGTVEPKYLKQYLDGISSNITNIDFRATSEKNCYKNYNNYFLQIYEENNCVLDEWCSDNMFYRLFIESATLRKVCFSCPLAAKDHIADITMGDWDDKDYVKNKGIECIHPSICAVNTKQGRLLLDKIKSYIKFIEINEIQRIEHYYKEHTDIGSWGYNMDKRDEFEILADNYPFKEAAERFLYKNEFEALERISKSFTKISIYGCGKNGKLLYDLITRYFRSLKITEWIVSEKKEDKCFGIPIKNVDEIRPSEDNLIIVSPINEIRKEICRELNRREIYNYCCVDNIGVYNTCYNIQEEAVSVFQKIWPDLIDHLYVYCLYLDNLS